MPQDFITSFVLQRVLEIVIQYFERTLIDQKHWMLRKEVFLVLPNAPN